LVSDENSQIRASAAELISKNYIEQSVRAIKWAIDNENSSECLLRIYDSLKAPKNKVSSELLKIFKNSYYFYNRNL